MLGPAASSATRSTQALPRSSIDRLHQVDAADDRGSGADMVIIDAEFPKAPHELRERKSA